MAKRSFDDSSARVRGQHTINGNAVSGNGASGVTLISSTVSELQGKIVSGNDDDGFTIDTMSTGNVLKKNVANENGRHGISTATADVTLDGNRADRNGLLGGGDGDDVGAGISAVVGTTNGKNKAAGNDDPQECEPADVGCFVP
jgi:parallel beta-helix repeat protein